MKLDETDLKILALLKGNGKMNNKQLAAEVGLTVTPTFERVKRLERIGVIQSYQAVIDKKAIGKGLSVHCHVTLKSHLSTLISEFESAVVELVEVSACHHIAGDFDYLLLVEVSDMDEYQMFLREKLSTIPSIGNVRSSFVMNTLKE